ncbi:MAG: BlaI/MecI/CopY family transcriptional regulator [Clostridia bacterium]|nr:BlaI/MecI/CopY family transcriptional regulator [Clostridia bacterium]
MADMELGEVQARFADLVWEHEPITSGELVKLCQKELNWKKPTTYTVLRKLCEKGIFQNDNGTVRAVVSREDFYSAKSERFVEETYHGSLPAFVAAFMSRKTLSDSEAEEIRRMIDAYRRGQ